MLLHLVGQSNRADIRRLRQLEADLAEHEAEAARKDNRILELMAQRDALSARNRTVEAACAVPVPSRPDAYGPPLEDTGKALECRLAREKAHSEALEEKVAILVQPSGRLCQDLDAQVGRSRALEAEVAALEAALTFLPSVRRRVPILLVSVAGRSSMLAAVRGRCPISGASPPSGAAAC